MSGDCPECGRAMLWGGARWVEHGELEHRMLRRVLLKSAAQQLVHLYELKEWQLHLDAGDFVGIRWRNGVYPGWQTEDRVQVPREAWDVVDRDELLRNMRMGLTALLEEEHGVQVNQATWFHKIYEP